MSWYRYITNRVTQEDMIFINKAKELIQFIMNKNSSESDVLGNYNSNIMRIKAVFNASELQAIEEINSTVIKEGDPKTPLIEGLIDYGNYIMNNKNTKTSDEISDEIYREIKDKGGFKSILNGGSGNKRRKTKRRKTKRRKTKRRKNSRL